MIKALFMFHDGVAVSFEISGHSGYAEAGADIVCSAVSSAAYMTANTVSEILGLPIEAEVLDGYMKVSLELHDAQKAQVLTDGLYLHLQGLQSQYPDYLEIKRGVFNA